VDELVIVRHAIAEDRDGLHWPDDGERPLTAAGADRFARAARGLARLVPEVEAVLSSPAVRAWQTAELLEREAGWPAPEPCDALAVGRAPEAVLASLAGHGSAAVVGHEPQLSEFASLLLVGDPDAAAIELKKGGAVVLACPYGALPGRAVLRWSASPKMLRGLARP
jgi:phosphohistidine phosphatase